jgi:hypothetical protein
MKWGRQRIKQNKDGKEEELKEKQTNGRSE